LNKENPGCGPPPRGGDRETCEPRLWGAGTPGELDWMRGMNLQLQKKKKGFIKAWPKQNIGWEKKGQR